MHYVHFAGQIYFGELIGFIVVDGVYMIFDSFLQIWFSLRRGYFADISTAATRIFNGFSQNHICERYLLPTSVTKPNPIL